LVAAGVVRRKRDGVRLIGGGELKVKVQISVTGATKSASEAVEKAGGSITVRQPAKPADEPKAKPKAEKAAKAAKAADEGEGDDAPAAEENDATPADDED
jgi:hypothetical protein